jgi:hypothetical protein
VRYNRREVLEERFGRRYGRYGDLARRSVRKREREKMSDSFEQAKAMGELGERFVKLLLERKGFIVYRPDTGGAHWIDIIALKDKDRAIAMDVKTKSRRTYFPDTGVNQRQFYEYLRFSKKHNMPFYLVFVDEMMGQIYGNTLDELEIQRIVGGHQYPLVSEDRFGNQIRYWPLSAMKFYGSVDPAVAKKIKALAQRGYQYAS